MKKSILIILSFFLILSCNISNEKYPYRYNDLRIFKGTDVYELAKLVKVNDTIGIKIFLQKNPDINIDTCDKYYSSSLLMWAIYNNYYESFHCLLLNGSNPNFHSKYHSESPLTLAAHSFKDYKLDDRYCIELLEHGADVNTNNGKPLLLASSLSLQYVKALVEHGADLSVGKDINESPADVSIVQVKPEIAEYLIIEKKCVLYKKPTFINWDETNEQLNKAKYKIIDYLENHHEQIMYKD